MDVKFDSPAFPAAVFLQDMISSDFGLVRKLNAEQITESQVKI